jgi:site-specific DNA recombinase
MVTAASGDTLERPALRRLLADIEAGLVDVVVVYKIDRLSRALMDFAKLVEIFDQHGVTFVSVTQSFNTTTSMGRLTLNILLSFAQFEREVIGERIRDKFAASRARGMWMGGKIPLGYYVRDRKLVVNEAEAATVRRIFGGFVETGSGTRLTEMLRAEGVTTKRGKPINKGDVYKLLKNRTYIGEAVHKGRSYPGEHQAIVSRDLWDRVHVILTETPRARANRNRSQTPALLRGLIFGADGRAARADSPDLTEAEVRDALEQLDPLWDELFPAEQARIVRLLVERVELGPDGADIRLRVAGLTSLVRELGGPPNDQQRAAA